MDNLENLIPNVEGIDISGSEQLLDNSFLNNNILQEDINTSGSFQDPLLLGTSEIIPLTVEENFTGEISESEIAPIELNSNLIDSPQPQTPQSPSPISQSVNQPSETGVFRVNDTGEFTVDFLFDAGSYKSEFAIFSLAGMGEFTPGTSEYIKEAARRALSNSESGYIIIGDDSEGAKFSGELGESNKNAGSYLGIKSFSMNPGDDFAFMLAPQGKIQDIFNNPAIDGDKRPLFSIASANPGNAVQMMQLLDGAVDGGVFGIEDLRLDNNSDSDYNDLIFHVKDATGKATPLVDVVNSNNPWYETVLGVELIDFARQNNSFDEITVDEPVENDINQPSEITVGLVNDSGSSSTDNITNDPSLTGTISNVSQVANLKAGLNENQNLVDISEILESDGAFSLDKKKLEEINNGSLADGSLALTLQAVDSLGNVVGNANFAFTLDTTPPEAPTVLSGVDKSFFNKNNPTITGLAEVGSKVELFNNGQLVGETLAVDGAWEITTVALTDGLQSITAQVTDTVGNVSEVSLLKEFTIDTVAPQLNITSPVADAVITNGARLTGKLDETGSPIANLTYQFGDGNQVIVPVNQNGEFDVELDIAGLNNGTQTLTISITDLAGNTTSNQINVSVDTIDTIPPTAIISSNLTGEPISLDVTYNEPVSDAAFNNGSYSLTVSDEDGVGQNIEISSVEKVSDIVARLILANPLTQKNYQLAISNAITDLTGNNLADNTILDFSTAPLPIEISPANAEEMVTLTRETIVRFNTKVDPSTVNENSFYLIANGEKLSGRIVVSSTEEFATFFYDKPLPQSTEIRVVVDGDKIKSRNGTAIDGNQDGVAGGIATADFTTLPLTQIEGTDVWGYVYDSYNRNPDGSNIPLEGVVIRLDSLPDVFAVTDETGYFKLENVPAPDFYVYIDGSNVVNTPEGTQYASLGKAFHSVPGQEIQLEMDGEPFDVYLPTMAAEDIVQLSDTEDTDVGFGEASLEFLQREFPDIEPEAWQQTQVTFVAGSAIDDAGNAATQAMIVPVDPQRLPAPLPPTANPGLVISIQAGGENGFNREADGGATNFDVPAPVTFPNLEGLKPGEKSLIWTFNHDAGDWEVIGTGTVSEDGKSIVSDEGVGIRAPGWHFANPGTEDDGDVDDKDEGDDEEDDDKDEGDDEDEVTFEAGISFDGEWTPPQISGKFGFELPTKLFANIVPGDDQVQPLLWTPTYKPFDKLDFDGSASFQFTVSEFFAKFVPEFDYKIFDATGNAAIKGQAKAQAEIKGTGFNPVGEISGEIALNVVTEASGQIKNSPICNIPFGVGNFLCKKHQLPEIRLFGPPTIEIPEISYTFSKPPIVDFNETIGPIAEISVDTELKLSPRIFLREVDSSSQVSSNLSPSSITPLSSSLNADSSPVRSEAQLSNALITEAQLSTASGFGNDPRAFYRYVLANGSEITGRTNDKSKYSTVLPPNTDFNLFIYSPRTNKFEIISGTSGVSGTSSKRTTSLSQIGGPDTDGDGIPDFGEFTIGTNYEKFDTDNDGISDLAEIEQGLDPLGGRAFPTGIISSLPLEGEAKAVTVKGSVTDSQSQTAYVATGSHGLAIVDASQFNNPIILGQLDLLGDATDVSVDTNLQIAAVAANRGGLQLVDVSDPMLPTLSQTVNISQVATVEVVDGIAYFAGENSLQGIDLLTGEAIPTVTLPGSGKVTDIARDGNRLYTFTSGSQTLSIVDINNGEPSVIGQIDNVPISDIVNISVANDIIYLGGAGFRVPNGITTIDVSEPTKPTLISNPDFNFDARGLALNGSGLALVGSEIQGRGIGIYDISDPQNTSDFISQITTPGRALEIAIASGIAFVADDSSGLQVINYLGFDNQGQPPRVTITSPGADLDGDVEGIQVLEGSYVPIQVDVEDDVQVRNVELLVNGEVVSNDVSFPFDLTAIAFNDDPEATTVDVQVRATDTGGNSTLSNTLTFNLVPDTFAPNIISTSPQADGRRKNIPAISVRFNEAIDKELLDLNGITLTNLGADEAVGGDDDTAVTVEGFQTNQTESVLFVLPPADLTPGKYQLTIDPSIIADRSGNSLAEAFTLEFTKRPLITPLTLGEITTNVILPGENEVYTFEGTKGQELYFDGIKGSFLITTELISPSGEFIFSNQTNSDKEETVFLPENGVYQLIVKARFANNFTGDYSFRLSDIASTTKLDFDTEVNGTVESTSETDLFQFEGEIGQRLYFNGTTSGDSRNIQSVFARLISPSGVNLFDGLRISSETELFTLVEAGDYKLIVDGLPANYIVKLSDLTSATELSFDTPTVGTLESENGIKLFKFEGTAGQKLLFNNIEGIRNWTIYEPDNQRDSSYGSNFFELNLAKTGTYVAVLGGESTNYSFQVITPKKVTTDLTLGEKVNSSITQIGEEDIYKFTGNAGQRLYFDWINNENFTIAAQLISPSGEELFSRRSEENDELLLSLLETGTYQLIVDGGVFGSVGDYSFRLLDVVNRTEVSLGTPINGTLETKGETELFQLQGKAGQKLLLEDLGSTSGVSLNIYGPGNKFIQGAGEITLGDGTYYILVKEQNNNNENFNYSFQVTELEFIEPVNLPSTTIILGETVSSNISEVGEKDIYTFNGNAGQRLYFDGISEKSNFKVQLISPSGELLFTSVVNSNNNPLSLIETGTYKLIIDSNNGTNNTGDYNFRLLDLVSATEFIFDTFITGTLEPKEKTELFQFNGKKGQKLFLEDLGNQQNGLLKLYGPGNQLLGDDSVSYSGEITLPGDGTYIVVVEGKSNSEAYNYNFQIVTPQITTNTLSLGEIVTGNIPKAGGENIYTFNGSTGQSLYFDGISGSSNVRARLISSNGKQLFSQVLSADREPPSLIETGTYKLIISNSSSTNGDYSFRLLDLASATELSLDTPINGTLTTGTETDFFQFTGVVGQKLIFEDLGSDSIDASYSISGVGNQGIGLQTGFIGEREIRIPRDGNYILGVRGFGDTPINYRFRLK